MRLSTSLLLPAFISAASAISDASVYIFDGDQRPKISSPPTLSPEETRLVLAQRLGISEYHGLGDASESTLAHINTFGGPQPGLFSSSFEEDKAAELVLIVEGISSKNEKLLKSRLSTSKPAFSISNPPSTSSNLRLARELEAQIGQSSSECPFEDAINPFAKKCWSGKSKIIHIDLTPGEPGMDDFLSAKDRLLKFATNHEMHTIVILMPEACRTAKSSQKPYGSYEVPAQSHLGRRRQTEEPMAEDEKTSASPITHSKQLHVSNATEAQPLPNVPARCYSSLDACTNLTNSCSGHGKCYQKTGGSAKQDVSCFACMCKETYDHFLQGEDKIPSYRIIYWGGGACQKKDVSGPFWLFATFTVVMVGLVSWAIGMLFSIGEEKLPGVIGAGVSSNKVR